MSHAHGTFTVKVALLPPGATEGIAHYSLDKELQGEIEGTSKGEMMGVGDPKSGRAGYVAIEIVSGTVAGKRGSFALQHSSWMNTGAQAMNINVVPGSGTGELAGIAGTFVIQIEQGQHFYEFDYTLPG